MRGRLLRRAGGSDQRPLPREARHHGGGRVAGWPEMTARPQNRITAGWSGFIDPATGRVDGANPACVDRRSAEHTYELQSLIRNSSAAFCLNKNNDEQRN